MLHEQTRRAYKPAVQTAACQKLPGEPMEPASPLKYWVQVGECLKVDYLVVPTLIHWQQRRPAAVTMDMFVVDVAGETLLSRAHFEEIQAALSENLLAAPQFFSRGARWLTTEELAREGLAEMVKELGL